MSAADIGVPGFDGQRLARVRRGTGTALRPDLPALRVAKTAGITPQTLSALENGKRGITPRVLVALARTVGVEPWELLDTPRKERSLAQMRGCVGLTQKEVAEAIFGPHPEPGKDYNTLYSHIETGAKKDVPKDVVRRLADLFETTPRDIERAVAERPRARPHGN